MCDHPVWVLSQAKQRPHVADEDTERLASDLARQCPQCLAIQRGASDGRTTSG